MHPESLQGCCTLCHDFTKPLSYMVEGYTYNVTSIVRHYLTLSVKYNGFFKTF